MIGWIHATRRFLAKMWRDLASISYDKSGKITKRPNGKHRIRQVIKAPHCLTTEIWAGRNSALHEAGRGMRPMSLIDANIVRHHQAPERLLQDNSFYCEQPLHRLLSSSASSKCRWSLRVKRSNEKKANCERAQPRITKFFPTANRRQTHPIHHNGRPPDTTTPTTDSTLTPRSTTGVQRLMTYFLYKRASNKSIPAHHIQVPRHHLLCKTDGQGRVPFFFLL